METTSVIRLLPDTKDNIKVFAESIIESILSGNINALEVDYRLKAIEEMIKLVRKNTEVREDVINEVEKHGKDFQYLGANITYSQRKTYDYSNDIEYNELKEKLKNRENFLKNIPDEGTVDTATGELIHRPVAKYSDIITYRFV
jgi:hypothetical protein